MSTTDLLTNRLQKILTHYDLSASGLAKKIGIQRSSISHIISGRNKPSLDFITKLLLHFDALTFEWLIHGQGDFPKTTPSSPILRNTTETPLKKDLANTPEITFNKKRTHTSDKSVAKVIIFYTDGSFEDFQK